jgi:hypothetical protein
VLVTHSVEEAVFLGADIAVMGGSPAHLTCVIPNPGFGSPAPRRPGLSRHGRAVRAALAGSADARAFALRGGDGPAGPGLEGPGLGPAGDVLPHPEEALAASRASSGGRNSGACVASAGARWRPWPWPGSRPSPWACSWALPRLDRALGPS